MYRVPWIRCMLKTTNHPRNNGTTDSCHEVPSWVQEIRVQKLPEKIMHHCVLWTLQGTPLHYIKSSTKIHRGEVEKIQPEICPNTKPKQHCCVFIFFSKPSVDGFNLFEQILVKMGIFPRDRGEN